jgi:hypothetical protein
LARRIPHKEVQAIDRRGYGCFSGCRGQRIGPGAPKRRIVLWRDGGPGASAPDAACGTDQQAQDCSRSAAQFSPFDKLRAAPSSAEGPRERQRSAAAGGHSEALATVDHGSTSA